MKRLVVCFDGTWKRSADRDPSNIEKLARLVRSESDGVQQTVLYVGGVGANSYKADRVLGGLVGFGLEGNLANAYRFLALNYRAGDGIYVFGFSRGAFTARSLVGMIDRVGLLKSDALLYNTLGQAMGRYKEARGGRTDWGSSPAEFRRDYCHEHVCLPFLGVFDTVGALGPGSTFHDTSLRTDLVACARHALAVDEGRMAFAPVLWTTDEQTAVSGRLKQVWFEGYHSDVGGGLSESGLSDTTLFWMIAEAHRQGLAFNEGAVLNYLGGGTAARPHDSMNLAYALSNRVWFRPRSRGNRTFDRGARRVETTPDNAVGVASSVVQHLEDANFRAPQVRHWCGEQGAAAAARTEPVLSFPESRTAIGDWLARAQLDLSTSREPAFACPGPHAAA